MRMMHVMVVVVVLMMKVRMMMVVTGQASFTVAILFFAAAADSGFGRVCPSGQLQQACGRLFDVAVETNCPMNNALAGRW